MPSIAEIKAQYPDLGDLNDDQVVDALHQAFYQDMQRDQVASALGIKPIAAPAKMPERSWLGLANDSAINMANSAVGLVKSGVDLVAPDSAVSGAMSDFIKSGKDKQSDKQKFLDAQLADKLKQDAENDGSTSGQVMSQLKQAGTYIGHGLTSDPGKLVSETAGNLSPFLGVGKAMQAAKLGAGARTAVSGGLSGGLSAGEVRGNIWDKISGTPDADLMQQSPEYAQLRQAGVSELDAKREIGANIMRNLPEIAAVGAVGAATGKYGVEGMASNVFPKMGRVASGVVGGIDEGVVQGGTEQLASNYGVQRAMPSQSLTEGLGLNMAAEGMPGVAMGVASGGSHAPAPTLQIGNTPEPSPADQLRATKVPESGPMTVAVNAGIESQAKEIESLAEKAARIRASIDLIIQQRQEQNDAAELADLVESERRNQQVMLAQMDMERQKQAEIDAAFEAKPALEAQQRAAALEAPSAMQQAFQAAQQPKPEVTPQPEQQLPVAEPRIVDRTPDMKPMPLELAELQVAMDGGEVVRTQNQNGKYAYHVIKEVPKSQVVPEQAAEQTPNVDILNKLGKPFTNLYAAKTEAGKRGAGFEPVQVGANAFVVRKTSQNEQNPAPPAPAETQATPDQAGAPARELDTAVAGVPAAGGVDAVEGGGVSQTTQDSPISTIISVDSVPDTGTSSNPTQSMGIPSTNQGERNGNESTQASQAAETLLKPDSGTVTSATDSQPTEKNIDPKPPESVQEKPQAPDSKATAKPKKLTPNQRIAESLKARADYFAPGNIVKGYSGYDRVISYKPPSGNGDGWSVTVQSVVKQDGKWVIDPKDKRERTHSTHPDKQALASGPVERVAAEQVGPIETTHNGTRLYKTKVKLGGEVVEKWAVESRSNKRKTAAGERAIGGDSLHDTLDAAKKAADFEAKQDEQAQARKAEINAQEKEAQAKKDANKGKSIVERRKDAILDGATKLPVQAWLGNGTKRDSMQKAVNQERAIVMKMVDDPAAKKRDNEAIDLVRAKGFILGLSNENLPVVKAGLEAQARLKANDYKKPSYRVYSGRDTNSSFYEITKTEYDYAQEVKLKQAEASIRETITPAQSKLSIQEPVKPAGKIEDSGEVLEGARKLYAKNYAAKMDEGMGMDTAAVPLSKSWPEPDYQRLLDDGVDPWAVAMAHAMRDEIPAKPSSSWKVKGWVQKVESLRSMAAYVMSGSMSKERFKTTGGQYNLEDWFNKIDLYEAVGHKKSLKSLKFSTGEYSMYGGQTFKTAKKLWTINMPNTSNAATWSRGNWGTDLVVADTKEEAIEKFKAWSAAQTQAAPADTKATSFDIYSYRSKPGVFIVGKRISGTKSIDLKEFPTAKEAREYKAANQAELERLLGKAKFEPSERGESNAPRVGVDHRNGADVTSEQFRDTFGFRGEQFGASMPQAERQANMNQAYDALMDLAGVIGVPPKALSLNGELGLAFGARGHGGKGAFAAHYERDTTGEVTPNRVVINLTRKNGAGSLAHEWFHAVDNYFARMRGEKAGMLTESFGNRGDGVRPEMLSAFKQLMTAINLSGIKERSTQLDKKRVKDYWSTGLEMAARSFESYVIAKLQDNNGSNDYLANIVPESLYAIQSNYPYPVMGEMPAIRAAFDNFFDVVQTKETDKGVAMFSRSAERKSDVLSKDGKFKSWPYYKAWTRAEYNDVVSLLPEATRNDPHRREPLASEDWNALAAKVIPEIEALNEKLGIPGAFLVDQLGNITANNNKAPAQAIMGEAKAIADKYGLGIYVTNVKRIFMRPMVDKGFTGELGLGGVLQGQAAANAADANASRQAMQAPVHRGSNAHAVDAASHGTVMSYKPRGFSPQIMFSLGTSATGLSSSQVSSIVNAIRSQWDNAPDIIVASSMADPAIPQAVRDYDQLQKSQGAEGEPDGFIYRGKVYLIADQLPTSKDVIRVLFHETLGHKGLRGAYGDALTPILDQVTTMRRPDIIKKARQYGLVRSDEDGNPVVDVKTATDEEVFAAMDQSHKRTAAEEVLAVMAETRPEIGFVTRAVAAIRAWLRKHAPGFSNLAMKDSEIIAQFLLPARRFIEGREEKQQGASGELAFVRSEDESTAPDSGGAMLSRAVVSSYTKHATDKLNEAFNHPGTMSMWHKTVGSMYDLAERSPPFKRVFDAAQNFIQDVSFYATEAADLAPKILPKLDTWKDMLKTPVSAADNKAISAPILQGTLSWARDESGKAARIETLEAAAKNMTIDQKSQRLLRGEHISESVMKMWRGLPVDQYEAMIESKYESSMLKPGLVFTDAELVQHFNLTPDQIKLYKEFRAATDKSLDNLAKADLLRFGGKDVAPLRDMVMDAATVDDAAVMLRDYLHSQRDLMPERVDDLISAADGMIERADKVNKLKKEGYAPLSRFGRYSVDVVVDGERQYFSLFESKRAANLMAIKLKEEFGADNVAQGTMSQKEFEQFQGITPESLELFGNMLGLDSTGDEAQDKAFQTYLKLTKTNRSAMKRMIHRKGTTGFSEDMGRVLAAFVYSNARQTSAALHMGELGESVNDIPKGQGELKDAAIELSDYIKKPREEAQALRGLLFAQFLGGSVASAFVNFTQPLTVSFPYLSQFGGATKAGAALMKAMQDQKQGKVLESGLAQALKKAEEEGVVSPQSVHELMAQAQGRSTLNSGDGTRLGDAKAFTQNNFSKLAIGWGKLFGLAEQINRRSTFIAAYRIAVDQKIANPGAFATKAVNETQFISNKANKAKFGRGAIGATLMTFKSYSINYLELLHRMATRNGPEGKKAAALMLGMLFLMAGAGGLPFDDDLEDLADFIGQRLGYNFSSKKAKQEFLEGLFGKAMADFIDKGITGLPGSPIDTSGRMSMGNLIPGTGLLLKKRDHTGDLKELVGPVGDLIQRGFQGADKLLSGDVVGAAKAVAPKAVYNALKGKDMAESGAYNDDKGYKVIESTPFEAAMKAIGFQPASVADVQQSNYLNQRAKDFYSLSSQDINARWAKGIYEKDPEQISKAREMIQNWNDNNPDQRMKPNIPAILKRVREMRKDKAQRIADTAPKAMRAQMKRELATAG